MRDVYKLAEATLVNFLINKHSPISKTGKFGVSMFSVALTFVLIGIGFFLYAIYHWFLMTYPPFTATLLLGFIFLGLGFLAAAIVFAVTAYQRRKIMQMRTSITQDVKEFMDLVEEEFEFDNPLRENPKTTVAISSLVGFLLGDRYRDF